MSSPVARFAPSRRYFAMGIAALGGAALSVWSALRWDPAWLGLWAIPEGLRAALNPSWIAAALFAIPAAALLLLACCPAIEIHETHLRIGKRQIRWNQIARLDQTRWSVPFVAFLTLDDDTRVVLIHPGDLDSSAKLLRHLRRSAREALLDGVPYRQFWGERAPVQPPTAPPSAAPLRYPLLRPEDEEEVERMFQRLKSVGHIERRDQEEE